jgi:hypothetical protein
MMKYLQISRSTGSAYRCSEFKKGARIENNRGSERAICIAEAETADQAL